MCITQAQRAEKSPSVNARPQAHMTTQLNTSKTAPEQAPAMSAPWNEVCSVLNTTKKRSSEKKAAVPLGEMGRKALRQSHVCFFLFTIKTSDWDPNTSVFIKSTEEMLQYLTCNIWWPLKSYRVHYVHPAGLLTGVTHSTHYWDRSDMWDAVGPPFCALRVGANRVVTSCSGDTQAASPSLTLKHCW